MSGRCRKRPAEGAGGLDGGMRQSGRVRCGGRGGGRYGLVADGGRRAHRSPLTPVVPVPEARARPGSTAQPRGLCRAAAFVRVRPRPRGSRRAAAQPGPKAGHGAAHSHPPAGLHPPPPPPATKPTSTCPAWSRLRGCGGGSNRAGPHSTWLEKGTLMGTTVLPLGALRGSSEGARVNALRLGFGWVPETGD